MKEMLILLLLLCISSGCKPGRGLSHKADTQHEETHLGCEFAVLRKPLQNAVEFSYNQDEIKKLAQGCQKSEETKYYAYLKMGEDLCLSSYIMNMSIDGVEGYVQVNEQAGDKVRGRFEAGRSPIEIKDIDVKDVVFTTTGCKGVFEFNLDNVLWGECEFECIKVEDGSFKTVSLFIVPQEEGKDKILVYYTHERAQELSGDITNTINGWEYVTENSKKLKKEKPNKGMHLYNEVERESQYGTKIDKLIKEAVELNKSPEEIKTLFSKIEYRDEGYQQETDRLKKDKSLSAYILLTPFSDNDAFVEINNEHCGILMVRMGEGKSPLLYKDVSITALKKAKGVDEVEFSFHIPSFITGRCRIEAEELGSELCINRISLLPLKSEDNAEDVTELAIFKSEEASSQQ